MDTHPTQCHPRLHLDVADGNVYTADLELELGGGADLGGNVRSLPAVGLWISQDLSTVEFTG